LIFNKTRIKRTCDFFRLRRQTASTRQL